MYPILNGADPFLVNLDLILSLAERDCESNNGILIPRMARLAWWQRGPRGEKVTLT